MHNGISTLAGDVALLWNVPWHRHDNFSPAPLSLCVAGVSSSSGGQLLVSLGSLLDDQHWHHVKLERLSTHLNLTVDKNTLQVQIPADLSHWHIHTVRGNTQTHTHSEANVSKAHPLLQKYSFVQQREWVRVRINQTGRSSHISSSSEWKGRRWAAFCANQLERVIQRGYSVHNLTVWVYWGNEEVFLSLFFCVKRQRTLWMNLLQQPWCHSEEEGNIIIACFEITVQLTVAAVQSHGLQKPILSNRNFHGCLENLLYSDINLIDLAKHGSSQVAIVVSHYISAFYELILPQALKVIVWYNFAY